MDRYGSKSCMNPSVSRVHHSDKFFCSVMFVSGLVQGGELVTVRATVMVQGAF
jgi:hypothetical protein